MIFSAECCENNFKLSKNILLTFVNVTILIIIIDFINFINGYKYSNVGIYCVYLLITKLHDVLYPLPHVCVYMLYNVIYIIFFIKL